MKSFYKRWLESNKKENEEVNTTPTTSKQPASSEKKTNSVLADHNPTNIVLPTTSIQTIPLSQTDIVFENEHLKMVVEKGAFQRQKRFRFQDHLFFVKVLLKDNEDNDQTVPFLRDILEFIHEGLLHLMKTIKQFYNEKDENICYLTLHQNPMVVGLNSGA